MTSSADDATYHNQVRWLWDNLKQNWLVHLLQLNPILSLWGQGVKGNKFTKFSISQMQISTGRDQSQLFNSVIVKLVSVVQVTRCGRVEVISCNQFINIEKSDLGNY